MIDGYRPLQARLTAIGDTKGLLRMLGLETVAEAKRTVAHKTRTTSRSIRMTSLTEDVVTVSVGGAGAFLEHGTRPHIIRPRNRRALRFPAQGSGTTLGGRIRTGVVRRLGSGAFRFAMVVHHPGTKAQPFLIPAARHAISQFGVGSIIEHWNKAA